MIHILYSHNTTQKRKYIESKEKEREAEGIG